MRKESLKRAAQLVVGLGISAALLWMALKGVNLGDAAAAMQRVAWWVYPAYLAQLTVTHILRTLRWRLQMERLSGKSMAFWDALGMCSISFAGTFLLPFRLGELIRPFLATQRGYGRKSAGLATVALERVLDGLCMTGVLALMLSQMRGRAVPAVITVGGYVALLVFGGALAVFVAAYQWKELSLRFWGAVFNPISKRLAHKLLGMMDAFLEGLKSLPTPRDLAVYMGYTLGYWVLNGVGMWTLAQGMSLEVDFLGAFFVLACLVVGITIPAGPGNVGTFEYAIQISLPVFGVSAVDGAAYGIWTHLIQMAQMMLMCVPFLGMLHLSKMTQDDADAAPMNVA